MQYLFVQSCDDGPGYSPSPHVSGLHSHVSCQNGMADKALQLCQGLDYADLLAPEPTPSPWLICFTGSAM